MHVRDVPVYHWFAIPALICLALALTLRAIPFFVDRTSAMCRSYAAIAVFASTSSASLPQ